MLSLLRKNLKIRFVLFLLADVFFIALSIWLAFLIRFDGGVPAQYEAFLVRMIILAVIFTIPVFYFSKLYSFTWSYVSTNELVAIFKATTISFIFLGITIYVSKYFPFFANFPRSVLFTSYFLVFIFCGGIRFAKRIYLHQSKNETKPNGQKTLIVGAGDAGEQILRSIESLKDSPYQPVGFVDDNSVKQGVLIRGLKVLGTIDNLSKIIQDHGVQALVIALPSAGREPIRKAVDAGRKEGLRNIKIVPSLSEIIDGMISVRDLRQVEVEDLLGREKVSLNTKPIEDFIKGKRILITGAAGSIGSELSRQVVKFNPELIILLDWDETGIFNIANELNAKFPDIKKRSIIADIKDENKIAKIFGELKPNIVFHAAAYKHVPLMEEQPEEAVKNNVFGTKVIAQQALSNSVDKFIFISTDKAVNPVSVMGTTKRVGEMLCQAMNQRNGTKFVSVRFGNVLNSRGSVIPIFKEQIRRGGPVEVTHPDMKRYFMLTSEACLLVMQAGAMGNGGEVFVLDMGKPVKILDLAKEVIRLSGFVPDQDIKIVFTGPRPGEKLFEEMLSAEEGTIFTGVQKIFTARLSNINPGELDEKLKGLKDVAFADGGNVVELLKGVVSLPKK